MRIATQTVSMVLLGFGLLLGLVASTHASDELTASSSAVAANPVAIVVVEPTILRAGANDKAQQQTALHAGDLLEVRGERQDFLQVYDHRHERAGFVRRNQVRTIGQRAEDAPALLAIVQFLQDTQGAEALGIAYVAAYLHAAPANTIDGQPFAALGKMAERLARRASQNRSAAGDEVLAAQLDVAAAYGVVMNSFERDQRLQLCYDGEAFRRVLALDAPPATKAEAALALTRHDCVNPSMTSLEREGYDHWRLTVLDRVDLAPLADYLKNRLRMRRAGVLSAIAFADSKRNAPQPEMIANAQHALDALASINKAELTQDDQSTYTDAAIRVAAVRWAATLAPSNPYPVPAVGPKKNAGGLLSNLSLDISQGQPGETCVALRTASGANQTTVEPLIQRCTYAKVWPQSAVTNENGSQVALAVQPLASWRELWVFQRGATGWTLQVLPPATETPELGYVEFAGWVPGGEFMLVAREARTGNKTLRNFAQIRLDTLDTERQAADPEALSVFYRWQDPLWKRQTLSLR